MKRKMPKPEVMPERQTRDKILLHAMRLGCDIEVRALLRKYDNLLKGCSNESERKHISVLGVTEIHKLIGFRGGLTIGSDVIIEDENAPKEELIVPKEPDSQ